MFGYKEKDNGSRNIAMAVLLGAIAGGVCALLLAPKSGKEARRQLREKYDDTVEKACDILDEMQCQADHLSNRAKEIAQKAKAAANCWLNNEGK